MCRGKKGDWWAGSEVTELSPRGDGGAVARFGATECGIAVGVPNRSGDTVEAASVGFVGTGVAADPTCPSAMAADRSKCDNMADLKPTNVIAWRLGISFFGYDAAGIHFLWRNTPHNRQTRATSGILPEGSVQVARQHHAAASN
jgi:hypothetical protein